MPDQSMPERAEVSNADERVDLTPDALDGFAGLGYRPDPPTG